jgi:hypothetical protein
VECHHTFTTRWRHSLTEGCLTDGSADGGKLAGLPDHQITPTHTYSCGNLWQTGFTFHQRLQSWRSEWSEGSHTL